MWHSTRNLPKPDSRPARFPAPERSSAEYALAVAFWLSSVDEFSDAVHMSDVTNLRQFRKQIQRDRKRAKGAENATKFGQTKASRVLAATQDSQSRRMLDQHLLDDQDDG